MRTTLSTTFVLLTVGWLSACQPADNAVVPTTTAPTSEPALSYRLIKTQTNHPIPTTVDYRYVSFRRLGTSRSAPDADGIWKQLAPTIQYGYDANQQLIGTEGTIIYRDAAGQETSRVRSHYGTFTMGTAGLPVAYQLFANSDKQQGRLFEERTYTYDAAGRLSQETYSHYDENPAIEPLTTRYQLTYTGDDITTMNSTVSSGSKEVSTSRTVFEYDDNANPYYGLMVPELLPQYRYSRHNITKQTITSGTSPANVLTYKLTYAPTGTLTRWACSDGRNQTFIYETY